MAGAIAMGAALGHAALKSGRGMMHVPPNILAASVAAVAGHYLGVEAGAQVLGGDRPGDDAAVAIIKNTMPGNVGRLAPEAAYSLEVAAEAVHKAVGSRE